MEVYYQSVGHGANLLLNVSPDERGLLPDADVKRVMEFGEELRRRFLKPLAQTDGEGYEIHLNLPSVTCIDHVICMEDIAYGERIYDYVLEAEVDGRWTQLVHGSAIGHKKIDRFDRIAVNRIRLRVLSAHDKPLVRNMSVYCTGQQ